MASCPKCGKRKIRKNRKLGYRVCRRCGPISHNVTMRLLRENGILPPLICEEAATVAVAPIADGYLRASRPRATWKMEQ